MSTGNKESKEIIEEQVEEEKFLISSLGETSWKLFGVYYPVFISSVVFAKLSVEDKVTKTEMKQYIYDYMNHRVVN